MYKFPKILTIFFVCLIIIQTGAFLFVNLSTEASRAADSIKFKPQVEIPGFPSQTFTKDSGTKPIGDYIKAIYKYAIGIVGILAAVMLMVGGVVWLTAGGSADRIGKAKEYITASLTGLILALCSFMILSTINPALVDFKITNIEQVKKTTGKGCCQWNDGCENNYTENECEAEGSGGQKKGGNWKKDFTCSSGYCIKKENWYYNYWSVLDNFENSMGPFDSREKCEIDKDGRSPLDIKPYGGCYQAESKYGNKGESCGNDGGKCQPTCTLQNIDWGGRNCKSGLTCCKN